MKQAGWTEQTLQNQEQLSYRRLGSLEFGMAAESVSPWLRAMSP